MTKKEHLAYCKKRALEYVERGELPLAMASMASDMSNHPENKDHPAISMGLRLRIAGGLDTKEEMREFINGFN